MTKNPFKRITTANDNFSKIFLKNIRYRLRKLKKDYEVYKTNNPEAKLDYIEAKIKLLIEIENLLQLYINS